MRYYLISNYSAPSAAERQRNLNVALSVNSALRAILRPVYRELETYPWWDLVRPHIPDEGDVRMAGMRAGADWLRQAVAKSKQDGEFICAVRTFTSNSAGCAQEIRLCVELGIPIFWFDEICRIILRGGLP